MTRRFRAMALASFLVAATAVLAMPGVSSAATTCTQNPLSNVTVQGDLVVPPGAQCVLINVTVNGNVIVQPTGRFSAVNSTITGYIAGSRVQSFDLINVKVGGYVVIDGSASPTTAIGICNSTIAGNLIVRNVNSPEGFITIGPSCDPAGGNTIGGSVILSNNRTAVNAPIPGLRVQNNTIRGSLICSGNNPPAIGGNNTVTGSRLGECGLLGNG